MKLAPGIEIVVDDILIFSTTMEEHNAILSYLTELVSIE